MARSSNREILQAITGPAATLSRAVVPVPENGGGRAPRSAALSLRVLAVFEDLTELALPLIELARGGYEVQKDVAQTRNEFVVRLRGGTYDVILAHGALVEWTPMDLLSTIEQMELDIPVIITAPRGDDTGVDLIRAGAADYVVNEDLRRLPVAVGRAISERRVRRERMDVDALIAKLTTAVDQSPASVIFTDVSGRIEYVNRRFTEITGYAFREAVGRTPRLLSSGHNPASVYAEMWKTIRHGDVWRGDLKNRKRTGELYWDSVSISPVRDGEGVITHFLGVQEDITERKAGEQKIRDSEERLRQLADNVHEVFFVTSVSLREMLYISPGYERIWGRTCQSLYDNPQSFIDAIPREDQETLFAHVAAMQKGESPEPIEYRVVRPDGSVRWVLVNGAPIKDASGVVYRLSGSALDVTDRRATADALKKSEMRFRLLTEASFDGVVTVVDGTITEANPGLADMLGYSLDELIGHPAVDIVDEESRELVKAQIAGERGGIYEFIARHKNGQKKIIEAAAKPYLFDGQKGRITALRDITEKRNLENQFRQAQKMEAVGRLAGGVAHDFNNLLTVIMTYSELVAEELGVESPCHEDLEEIIKASKAGASLTKQLLAFSRQQVIDPRLVVLNDVVANADKMLRCLIGEDIELVSSLSEVPCPVLIDPGQLEQVIMNLAVNARDAMRTGGKLTLETRIVELDATDAANHWPAVAGQFALLSVTDTGCGMDAETRARIFEPFFTTKGVGEGTGLGLATVYGIVKQSGGFIWVYSEPGLGTTFKLYFPVAENGARSEPAAVERKAITGTETVLLVEDSQPVRSAARQILQRCGYRVLEASSGEAALAIAKKRRRIDLLLTDVVMPRLSGRLLAEKFVELRPNARVLFMSGYTDDAVVRHGILQSGIRFLQKPFMGPALAAKVRDALDGPPGLFLRAGKDRKEVA